MRRLPLAILLGSLSILSLSLLGFGAVQEGQPAMLARAQEQGGMEVVDTPGILAAPGMRFGIDAGSIGRFEDQAQVAPDYATVWVGKWNLDLGWRGTDAALNDIHARNVTPAVHFYYWGDAISKDCLEHGCNGKDVNGWQQLAVDLVQHLQTDLQGAPVVVILESEFNKHGVHEDETLDGLLAEKATYIKWYYPQAQIVLGLGNWYPQAWGTWDRAAAASDYVGLQALAASTQDPDDRVLDLFNNTLQGAQRLHDLFGKPVFVQDIAVSSYPEPDHLEMQEESVARFAQGLPELQQAGVEAVVYRSFLDVPDMALGNHYAEAERHWGLAWADSGELKPAGEAWLTAIQRSHAALQLEIAAATPPPDVTGS